MYGIPQTTTSMNHEIIYENNLHASVHLKRPKNQDSPMAMNTARGWGGGGTYIHSCVVILKQAHADPTLNTDIFTVKL